MKKSFIFVVTITAAVLSSSLICAATVQSPAPQATGLTQGVNPTVVAKAKEWFHRFQTASIDRSQLNAQVNAELTAEMIDHESATLRPFGNPSAFKFIRTYMISGKLGYDFLLQFAAGRIIEMIAFDPDGEIAGIDFQTFVKNK